MTLKDYRKRANLQPYEVAVQLKISPGLVTNWESGKSEPRLSDIARLRRIYNLTDSEILELLEETK